MATTSLPATASNKLSLAMPVKTGDKSNPRLLSARAVHRVVIGGRSLDDVLDLPADHKNKALVQEMVYGVLRWFHQLDGIAYRFLDKPLKPKDQDVYALLLVGLYQLLHMDTMPHAAVNETVSAATGLGKPWAKNLLNACLRRAQRTETEIHAAVTADEMLDYSHPQWLLEKIKAAYTDDWRQILRANNQRPPMHLRVNRQRIGRDDYINSLSALGRKARPIDQCDSGVALDRPCPVSALPGFSTGLVSVQDAAAQLAAALLDLEPGLRVLDACAAPGGKTCHILEREPGLANMAAVEKNPKRAELIENNLRRLGLVATVIVADATTPASWWDGRPFQRILLDAPCSATGVIRRHPDIKLHRTPADIAAATRMQAKLLEAVWPLLDSGGKLLYATCSILPEENAAQITDFLARHTNASEIALVVAQEGRCQAGCQILPGDSGMDGFYYACLQKG